MLGAQLSLSPKEWSVLFPHLPAGSEVDAPALVRALERAAHQHTLPDARIAELKKKLSLGTGSASSTAGRRDSTGWVDLQNKSKVEKSTLELQVLHQLAARADVVRVTTENGSNFGHQHAAVAAIRELRELGFRGKIELIVPAGADQKMVQLLPGFDPKKGEQHIAELDLVCVLERAFDARARGVSSERAIGLVAASDHDEQSFGRNLGTRGCVVLQPYDWPGERRLEIAGKKVELDLPGASTFVYEITDPLAGVEKLLPAQMGALAKFVAEVMSGQPPDIARKAEGILALFRGVLSGRVDLMPAYGLHAASVERHRELILHNLEGGVRAFQKNAGAAAKPAVILEIGPHGVEGLSDPGLNTRLRTAKKDEVLTVSAGSIPRPIFELLYKYATLPSVLEGANTSNLVQLLGKPFLSVYSAMTGLPKLPGVEGVERISSGLAKDVAEEEIGRLQKMLSMFAGLKTQAPPAVFATLGPRLRAGLALTAGDAEKMKADVLAALVSSRPGAPKKELEGLAGMIAEQMKTLSSVLSELPALPSAIREAIADFDPRSPTAAETGQKIIDACHQAIEALVSDRFAAFIERSREPSSPVGKYFAGTRDAAHSLENRQVLRGLDQLFKTLDGVS